MRVVGSGATIQHGKLLIFNMENPEKVDLISFVQEVDVCFTPVHMIQAQKAVNMHYLGDEECNCMDLSCRTLVPKYPEKESRDFIEASATVTGNYKVKVKIIVDSTGAIRLEPHTEE